MLSILARGSSPQWFSTKLLTIIFPILFFILFGLYISNSLDKKKELIFWSPLIVIAFLLITRLLLLLPLFNKVYPDSYSILFIFCSLFLFFKIRFYKLKKFVSYSLIILPIFLVVVSLLLTPLFKVPTPQDEEIISFFESVEGRIVILTGNKYQLHAYSSIYNNLSSPFGGTPGFLTFDLFTKKQNLLTGLKDKECKQVDEVLKDKELDIDNIITSKDYCSDLKLCKFKPKTEKENSCLFKLKR